MRVWFLFGIFLQVTSQHPYAEAIGEPYVWMVDMYNQTDVHRALTAILNHSVRFIFSLCGLFILLSQRNKNLVGKLNFCSYISVLD